MASHSFPRHFAGLAFAVFGIAFACAAQARDAGELPKLAAAAPAPAAQGQAPDVRRFDQEWFDAARAGRVDILKALLDAHFPVDAKTGQGYTALILAAYNHQPQAVDFLLPGADACLGDRNGNTALMGVLFKGYDEVAHRLLQTNCKVDQANNAGETALSFAALFGRVNLLPELVARGANPNHVDARGGTALTMARLQGNSEVVDALRKAGATR